MRHELVRFENGTATLRDPRTGEAMHSLIGPFEEAELIYVRQSRLADRLRQDSARDLVLFDLGLGIAANAVAALRCAELTGGKRRLRLISYENDLDGFSQALELREELPCLQNYVPAARQLLSTGRAEEDAWIWELREGNYPKTLAGPAPELIFYDFYSPKTLPELWSEACLFRLREHCDNTSCLFSYSASTAFRAALLAAGFFVGEGTSTEVKRQTTVAATCLSALEAPLQHSWTSKLQCSGAIDENLRHRALASSQFSCRIEK